MRVLSLFSGIGAHDLGLEWAGFEIVGQVEIDEFCQKILKKHFPKAKRWTDICAVTANDIRRRCGRIDLITGGFPCQDISTAGKQKGLVEGERSGLWREMWRLIRDLRPDWLLLENVPSLRTKGSDNIIAALEGLGYTCWPLVVGAVHAGAPHERRRVWIVAYASRNLWRTSRDGLREAFNRAGEELGDTNSEHGGQGGNDGVVGQSTARRKKSRSNGEHVANTDGELGRAVTDEAGRPLVAAIEKCAQSESDGVSMGDAENERCFKGGCQVEMETRKNPDLPTQAELMYPTPTATEYGSNSGGERPGPSRPSLSRLVQQNPSTSGNIRVQLNPLWVAQLMGLPDGWLDLDETSSKRSETRTRRKSRT